MEIADTIFFVLGSEEPYSEHSGSNSKYTEGDIINIKELITSWQHFVDFRGKRFQQMISICDPLLADIFLHSNEAEFVQSLLSVWKKKHLSSTSHMDTSMTYKYCPLLTQTLRIIWIRCIPLSFRSMTGTLLLNTWIYSADRERQLRTSLHEKRYDFNFHLTNVPFLSSNISYSLAYDDFISQLIRYARVCSSYGC